MGGSSWPLCVVIVGAHLPAEARRLSRDTSAGTALGRAGLRPTGGPDQAQGVLILFDKRPLECANRTARRSVRVQSGPSRIGPSWRRRSFVVFVLSSLFALADDQMVLAHVCSSPRPSGRVSGGSGGSDGDEVAVRLIRQQRGNTTFGPPACERPLHISHLEEGGRRRAASERGCRWWRAEIESEPARPRLCALGRHLSELPLIQIDPSEYRRAGEPGGR